MKKDFRKPVFVRMVSTDACPSGLITESWDVIPGVYKGVVRFISSKVHDS